MTRLLTILALIALFAWLLGGAIDQEAAAASKSLNSGSFRSASPGVLSDNRFIPTSGVLSERSAEGPDSQAAAIGEGDTSWLLPGRLTFRSESTSAGLDGRGAAAGLPQSSRPPNPESTTVLAPLKETETSK